MPPERLIEPKLPSAVFERLTALEATGAATFVVGECLADLLLGSRPAAWTIATTASPGQIIDAFPTAVPTSAAGVSFALPTRGGPIDLLPLRGSEIVDELARRSLTRHAIAWAPVRDERLDPHDGLMDLRDDVLRTVGESVHALRRNPVAALIALRLHAQRGAGFDPELERALGSLTQADVARVPTPTRRRELRRMLAGRGAGRAVDLLRRSGLELTLGVRARADAPALLAAAPSDPVLRLAIWLRGSRAGRFVRTHRMPRAIGEAVLRVMAEHPIDRTYNPRRRTSMERLDRLPEEERERLFWLREHELEAEGAPPAALAGLGALRAALDAHRTESETRRRRPALAIGGQDVMRAIGTGPGPWIGQALQFLAERVEEDPSCNEPERLVGLLRDWWRQHPTALPPKNTPPGSA